MQVFVDSPSVDVCYLEPTRLLGQTLCFRVSVEGIVSELDGMILDFAVVKKAVKTACDLVDHKIVVSDAMVKHEVNGSGFTLAKGEDIGVTAEYLAAKDEFVIVDGEADPAALAEIVRKAVEAQVKKKVTVVPYTDHLIAVGYAHCLPKHAGKCQRLHGHSMYVKAYKRGDFSRELSDAVAESVSGKTILSRLTIQSETEDFYDATFRDLPDSRNLTLPKAAVMLLDNEPTIENLSAYLCNEFDCDGLLLTEGFGKGAMFGDVPPFV